MLDLLTPNVLYIIIGVLITLFVIAYIYLLDTMLKAPHDLYRDLHHDS